MFLLMGAFRAFFNVICEVWKISLQLPVKTVTPAQAQDSFKTFKLETFKAELLSDILLAVCLGSTWREVSFLAQALNTYMYIKCDSYQRNQ